MSGSSLGVMADSHSVDFPPLSRRQETVRLLAAALIGLGFLSAASSAPGNEGFVLPWGLDLALGAVSLVAAHWRRRRPLPVGLAVMAMSSASVASVGAVVLVLVSAGTRRRWREIIVVSVASLVAGSLFAFATESHRAAALLVASVFGWVLTAALVGWGMYIGERRTTLATLKDRAERAERERDLQAEAARTAERTRIAREMHDVLAHRMSLIAMHAGALSYRDDLSNEEVCDAARLVQGSAHRALEELRQVLGALRPDAGDAAVEAPQPTLSDVEALVDEARAGGMKIALDRDADLTDVSDTTGRGAYRIVQEALTNARKHAPGARVTVMLTREGDDLVVSVHNPLALGAGSGAPGSGLGLIGLRERAELLGGSLVHTEQNGTFTLEARLPVNA